MSVNNNKQTDKQGTDSSTETVQTKLHPIKDFIGKDDNVNFVKYAIDTDVTTKWAFDAFPFYGVIDLADPPKQIDFIRIVSENEQPVNIDFSNDNTITGYSGKISKTLKKGVNVIETRKDLVARYIRLQFTGNKALDEDKNQKPDPVGIFYVQVGQGKAGEVTDPTPEPPVEPPVEPPTGPAKPTEGRIKDWGGDINKGAKGWKAVVMKDNAKLYKVVDKDGKNIADLFSTQTTAQQFIDYYIFKQGKDAEVGGGNGNGNGGGNGGGTNPPPSGTGLDKNGVKLLVANGGTIIYDYKNNFRDDGKRFDANVGDWPSSEATAYFRFTKDPVDDEISAKFSEKSHSGSNMTNCYDLGLDIKSGKTRMRFEARHPDYSGNIGGGQGTPQGTKWIGYKAAKIVNTDGTVTIKYWQDIGDNEGNTPANQWKEVYSHIDTKYKRTGAHPYITWRVDDPEKQGQKNLEIKWVSFSKI